MSRLKREIQKVDRLEVNERAVAKTKVSDVIVTFCGHHKSYQQLDQHCLLLTLAILATLVLFYQLCFKSSFDLDTWNREDL